QGAADKQLSDASGQAGLPSQGCGGDLEPIAIWRYSRATLEPGQEGAGRNMETITTAPQMTAAKSFTVRPLSPALGAEILGVDLRDPIDEALKQKFLDTWHQNLV